MSEYQKNPSGEKSFGKSKIVRGGISALLIVIFIAVVVVLNVIVSLLSERYPSMNVDLTAKQINSLSEDAMEVAKGIQNDTEIIIIGAEDAVRQDRILSQYGLQFSQVANLAERMREANQKISVRFVDPDQDPKFISEYSSDALTTGKVMVKTEKRYRVLTINDMFGQQQNQTTGQAEYYSMVDSALANAVAAANMDKVPVVAIATGHGEMLAESNMAQFMSLLKGENYEVKTVNFLSEELPEGTQVVLIPTPTTDYTEEEITKLRTFLDDTTSVESLSVMVTCHPSQGQLPKFASFLEEWGVKVEQGVVAETDTNRFVLGNATSVLVDATETLLPDNTYSNLVSIDTAPITILFDANNDISVKPLWTTSDKAVAVQEEGDLENAKTQQLNAATLSMKMVQVDGSTRTRNLMVFGSSVTFTDTFMGTSAFGMSSYVKDTLRSLTGTDGAAVSIPTQRVSATTVDITASASLVSILGLGVFTIGLPVLILVGGLVVFLRRRHL